MKNIKYAALFLSLIIIGCNSDSNNKIEASGTIESTNVIISSKVRGEIKQKLFIEGDKVEKGDTLYIIDTDELNIQLKRTEAAMQMADAQLRLLIKGARKEDVLQAQSLLKQTEINLNKIKKDKERIDKLFKSNAVSEKQRDDITAAYQVALAKYKSAKQNFSKVSKNYSS